MPDVAVAHRIAAAARTPSMLVLTFAGTAYRFTITRTRFVFATFELTATVTVSAR